MPVSGHLEDYIDGLPEEMAPDTANDMLLLRKDSDGSMEKISPATLAGGGVGGGWTYPADGRLTLETGVPISTTDQLAKATLYYTPYIGDQIALYNGATWDLITFAEISISLAALDASKSYDVFCYNNTGTATLELLVWTNPTTRATALVRQSGILCKTGALTRRYLGTIYTSSAGQCEDSLVKRFIWNYYNRKIRRLFSNNETSHAYTTATVRPWNNDTQWRVNVVYGVVEDPLFFSLQAQTRETAGSSTIVTIGYDVTNAISLASTVYINSNTYGFRAASPQLFYPGIGFHFFQVEEYGCAGANFDQMLLEGYILG